LTDQLGARELDQLYQCAARRTAFAPRQGRVRFFCRWIAWVRPTA